MGMSEARKWATEELGNAAVRDQRVCNRLVDTLATLAEHPGRTIPQACGSWAKTKAAYRLLDNDSVSPEIVLGSHRERTIERMRGYDVVLALQDTTHMVYSGPPNEEVGMCSASQYKRGLLTHSTMAVTTEGVALGLLDQKIWTRLPEETGKHILRKKRPIADKESSKWLKSLDCSLEGIPNDITVVMVCDREADVHGFIHKEVSVSESVTVAHEIEEPAPEGRNHRRIRRLRLSTHARMPRILSLAGRPSMAGRGVRGRSILPTWHRVVRTNHIAPGDHVRG